MKDYLGGFQQKSCLKEHENTCECPVDGLEIALLKMGSRMKNGRQSHGKHALLITPFLQQAVEGIFTKGSLHGNEPCQKRNDDDDVDDEDDDDKS